MLGPAVAAVQTPADLRTGHRGRRTAGIRNDQQAVVNGLTLPYSSGKVEGTVNKIKCSSARCTGMPPVDLLRTGHPSPT